MSKVLLIEDEEFAINYFKKKMAEHDIEVDSCNNIKELRNNYCNLKDYKVVFIDLKIGDDGMCSKSVDILKEMMKVTDKPFYVVWTAFGEFDQAEKCLEAGASLIVKKDGDIDKLLSLVNYIGKAYVA